MVLITNGAYSMLPENISIVDSPCLHKQTIPVPLERDTVKCFLGIGVLNSKSEVSVDLPLDILIPLGAIQNLVDEFKHQGKDFSVDILLADKNALLQVTEEEKITQIHETTALFQGKLPSILDSMGLTANTRVILGSDLYLKPEYRSFSSEIEKSCMALQNTDPFEREQLLTMKWYKQNGCDFRLSWAVCGKKPVRRDEAVFDEHYRECFKDEPMKSIYIKSGRKTLPHGLGTAVPYAFYPSEEGNRLSLSSSVPLDFIPKNEMLVQKHIIPLINMFRRNQDFLPTEILELVK